MLVRQTDLAGNVSDAGTLSFTLDTTPPVAPTAALKHDTGTSNADNITNDGSLSVSGVEGDAATEYSADKGTTWSSSFVASEGTNKVLVRQSDVAGNVSDAATLSFLLDTSATARSDVLVTFTVRRRRTGNQRVAERHRSRRLRHRVAIGWRGRHFDRRPEIGDLLGDGRGGQMPR